MSAELAAVVDAAEAHTAARAAVDETSERLNRALAAAHAVGHTYAELGAAAGVTAQGAWHRVNTNTPDEAEQ
ncbi:MAG: hypothetical protein S0880_10355 [Actinomycetota bacterium]|nr:hypothetical protein [Actinomycetota bacterium]